MLDTPYLSPEQIRTARAENPKLREREFAQSVGISEAQLVAAYLGQGVTRINPHPDAIMEHVAKLGEVLALTRNESCVIERVGHYDDYRAGQHAAMVLNAEIDLRIFPGFWAHAFAVEKEGENGLRRSIQVFSKTGMAVHKIHLRDSSNHEAWAPMVAALTLDDQGPAVPFAARKAPEPPKGNPEKAEKLRAEWDKMTDTHQFMRLTNKLKMNRLGAYRVVGDPYVQLMDNSAVALALRLAAERQAGVMIFVGNRGCIQIHGGPIEKIVPMGPWVNVMDPRFNLHLRADHIAETYVVTKPTQRGPAVSLEAFDAEGRIILQIFPDRRMGEDNVGLWDGVIADLPRATQRSASEMTA
jgi:putative hemin transport protein